MKFTVGAILCLASTALAGVLSPEARDLPGEVDCISLAKYRGIHRPTFSWSPACSTLSGDCSEKLKNTTYVWHKTSCVAAAVCESPESIVQFNRCPGNNPKIPEQNATSELSKNIYRDIVGDCAEEGCPMTQQNFVDLVYGALSAINSTTWPNLNEVELWWKDLKDWTKTGETVPYSNFNDFLHYRRY